jgi:hypothetical protein
MVLECDDTFTRGADVPRAVAVDDEIRVAVAVDVANEWNVLLRTAECVNLVAVPSIPRSTSQTPPL